MDESSAWVSKQSLSEKLGEFDFIPEEWASDIDSLAPDNSYSLSCISA